MHIEYKFDTSTIQQKFKKLAQVMDGRDITRKVAGVLRQEAEKAFDQEKTPEGESWEKLNEDYKKTPRRGRLHRQNVTGYGRFGDKLEYRLWRQLCRDWGKRILWAISSNGNGENAGTPIPRPKR